MWEHKIMEDAGIDPATSRMRSERSTIWANPPDVFVWLFWSSMKAIFIIMIISEKLHENSLSQLCVEWLFVGAQS